MSGSRASRRVAFRVLRYRPEDLQPPRFDAFTVDVDERMTVLDALEEIRATSDPTLVYRHSCHHASCGTCAVKVNGREVLGCVTNVLDLRSDTIVVEPLGVLPIVADLVVDMAHYAGRAAPAGLTMLRASEKIPGAALPEGLSQFSRYEDCIECGACISACPVANTDPEFTGPAGLAAICRALLKGDSPPEHLIPLADCEHGAWRCHSGWECTAVCPSDVDPAGLIMLLRRKLVAYKLRRLLRRRSP